MEGRRVTDDESALEVATMVLNGQINTRILAACRDRGSAGRRHQRCRCRPDQGAQTAAGEGGNGDDKEAVDYGFVGDIDSVDADILRTQLDSGLVPVISPLSADQSGTLLNINADTVAAALAGALDAEKLILTTGAPGILQDRNDPKSRGLLPRPAGSPGTARNGSLADGMLPKAAPSKRPSRAALPGCM